jgi:putative transposase
MPSFLRADGRRFRALTIVDVFTRESLAIEVGPGLRGEGVVRTLNRSSSQRGRPKFLFCDNGSESPARAWTSWAYQNGVQINYSRPRKPTDNAHVESFNGTLQSECLDAHWVASLTAA